MIKPLELDNEQGQAIWETMCAADAGDTAALRRLLDKDPGLSRSEYWYQHPLHYAVRGGHLDAQAFGNLVGAAQGNLEDGHEAME